MVKRGEVRWYQFAPPDKRRPVVVLTRDSVISYLGEVTVAPVTTTIRDIPSEVRLSREEGMPRDCAVNCDHLQTVGRERIGSLITTLSVSTMEDVASAICFALALS
jgi:mRNA interferase MazF